MDLFKLLWSGHLARIIFKNRHSGLFDKKENFSYGILRLRKQAPVLFQRTFAMRQGIHSLSDYRFYLFVETNGQGRVPTDLTDSRNDRKTQNCDKHNQGIKLSATALKVFQTFATNQGEKPC